MHVRANVVLARCTESHKLYGMRVQQHGNDWVRTWAFPIHEDVAVKEGFDKVQIQGRLNTTADYPGCPYCGTRYFFVCGKCRKMNCYHKEDTTVCEWCGDSSATSEADSFRVTGGGY